MKSSPPQYLNSINCENVSQSRTYYSVINHCSDHSCFAVFIFELIFSGHPHAEVVNRFAGHLEKQGTTVRCHQVIRKSRGVSRCRLYSPSLLQIVFTFLAASIIAKVDCLPKAKVDELRMQAMKRIRANILTRLGLMQPLTASGSKSTTY